MDGIDLPGWATSAGAVGTAFGAMVLAIWQGRKRKAEPEAEAKLGGATIVSDAGAERVTRALGELRDCVHDDARRLREAVEDNTRALEENTRATRDVMPSRTTPADLLALAARLDRIERDRPPDPVSPAAR